MSLLWLLQFGDIWDRDKGKKRTSLSHIIVLPLCKILTFSWFTWTGRLRPSVVGIHKSSQHPGGIPKAVTDVGEPVQKDLLPVNIQPPAPGSAHSAACPHARKMAS